jgi:UDP-N-acetylglucosamine acyltransferase
MPTSIHPSAVIHPNAILGEDCTVGPFCVLGEHVVLGPRCTLHSHVVIEGRTELGSDNEIFPFACLGGKTQDLKYRGGTTHVRIGDHNVFREYATVHAATADTHLAHDVRVGSHVIMSNVATLAGHVTVEDHVVIGGLAAVHQFCRIGRHAMIGGCAKVVQDIAPFMMADGNPAETRFTNKVGLERAGFSAEAISQLTKAYKVLFRSGLTTANALTRIEAELGESPEVRHLVAFTQSSERGLAK